MSNLFGYLPPAVVVDLLWQARKASGREPVRHPEAAPPAFFGNPLAVRRAECVRVLRYWRARREKATVCFRWVLKLANLKRRSSEGLPWPWWRWVDDVAANRLPWDFSQEARKTRRAELLARFLDGSLVACGEGFCPPAPRPALVASSRRLLRQ